MMISEQSPILEITGLRKEFGSTVALKDITFSVTEGEFIVILGRSGAGKSTLMRCINRLVEPTAGEIVFQKKVLSGKKEELRLHRRSIGMIFQHFNLIKRFQTIIRAEKRSDRYPGVQATISLFVSYVQPGGKIAGPCVP
ncbi:MAG: ATP-binding cassette domain-containing protein [Planctomycetota bacterium]|jgi:phosphonate transport system ATP-binding protein